MNKTTTFIFFDKNIATTIVWNNENFKQSMFTNVLNAFKKSVPLQRRIVTAVLSILVVFSRNIPRNTHFSRSKAIILNKTTFTSVGEYKIFQMNEMKWNIEDLKSYFFSISVYKLIFYLSNRTAHKI